MPGPWGSNGTATVVGAGVPDAGRAAAVVEVGHGRLAGRKALPYHHHRCPGAPKLTRTCAHMHTNTCSHRRPHRMCAVWLPPPPHAPHPYTVAAHRRGTHSTQPPPLEPGPTCRQQRAGSYACSPAAPGGPRRRGRGRKRRGRAATPLRRVGTRRRPRPCACYARYGMCTDRAHAHVQHVSMTLAHSLEACTC